MQQIPEYAESFDKLLPRVLTTMTRPPLNAPARQAALAVNGGVAVFSAAAAARPHYPELPTLHQVPWTQPHDTTSWLPEPRQAVMATWQWMAESLPSVSLRWEERGVRVGATAGSMAAMLLALSPLPRRRRKNESFSSSCALGRCPSGPKHLQCSQLS